MCLKCIWSNILLFAFVHYSACLVIIIILKCVVKMLTVVNLTSEFCRHQLPVIHSRLCRRSAVTWQVSNFYFYQQSIATVFVNDNGHAERLHYVSLCWVINEYFKEIFEIVQLWTTDESDILRGQPIVVPAGIYIYRWYHQEGHLTKITPILQKKSYVTDCQWLSQQKGSLRR